MYEKDKCPGEDVILNHLVKRADQEYAKIPHCFPNDTINEIIFKNSYVPENWNNAAMILFCKKRKNENFKNNRPVNLLSVIYKMLRKF